MNSPDVAPRHTLLTLARRLLFAVFVVALVETLAPYTAEHRLAYVLHSAAAVLLALMGAVQFVAAGFGALIGLLLGSLEKTFSKGPSACAGST